jgi:TetR/AcrR family transcriptional regulator
MTVAQSSKRLGSRGAPDASKAAILQAAIREFAREGVAGARTDAIARAAKVNKALLYYYFIDKQTLYGAALDHVFQKRLEILMPVLQEKVSPGEKILRYTGALFDYFAQNPLHREMVQREMLTLPRHPHMKRIMKLYFKPLYEELLKVFQQGIDSGVFRPVDPMQFIFSMGAVVVQYFSSAAFLKLVTKEDPLSREKLGARRAAVLDFISAALFAPTAVKKEGEGV